MNESVQTNYLSDRDIKQHTNDLLEMFGGFVDIDATVLHCRYTPEERIRMLNRFKTTFGDEPLDWRLI